GALPRLHPVLHRGVPVGAGPGAPVEAGVAVLGVGASARDPRLPARPLRSAATGALRLSRLTAGGPAPPAAVRSASPGGPAPTRRRACRRGRCSGGRRRGGRGRWRGGGAGPAGRGGLPGRWG